MTKLRAAALSDLGRVRLNNEDRALLDETLCLYGVADGVGGVPGGEEASQAAHDSILASLRRLPPGEEPDLAAFVAEANRRVAERGREVSPATGIATTLTFGCVRAGAMRIAHLGDSRCYAWHGGSFSRLTEDHNVENEAKRQRAQGESIPFLPADRHAITRCLGFPVAPCPDLEVRRLLAGDRYLFCTDGITNQVSDDEIAACLRGPLPADAILRELVDLALRRGGHDNATGVVLIVDEP